MQVDILDTRYTHTAALRDSHYRAQPLPGMPNNWVSPVNYTRGTLWTQVEVLSKPSDVATIIQICMEGLRTARDEPTYACTNFSPRYTTTGTYTWGTAFPQMYAPSPPSFTRAPSPLAVILKRSNGSKPQGSDPDIAEYLPTDLHVTMTLVPEGESYVPPGEPEPQPDPTPDGGASDEEPLVDDGGDATGVDGDSDDGTLGIDAFDHGASQTPDDELLDDGAHDVLGGCVAAPASVVWTIGVALLAVPRRRRGRR